MEGIIWITCGCCGAKIPFPPEQFKKDGNPHQLKLNLNDKEVRKMHPEVSEEDEEC